MPWCPKCKNEYMDGITTCADCKVDLVDELSLEIEYVPVAYIETEELADKFVKYLEYSSIPAKSEYNEEKYAWGVSVPESSHKEAVTSFKAFYQVESKNASAQLVSALEKASRLTDELTQENIESISDEDMSHEEKAALEEILNADKAFKRTEVYTKQSDIKKEMTSTAITFIVFSVLICAFTVVNALGILNFFNNVPSLVMLGMLSLGCLTVGINAIQRSKKAGANAVEEELLTDSVKKWLTDNITADIVNEADPDDSGEEIRYLKVTECIKEKLLTAFPELDENYADSLVEEHYDDIFSE